MKTAKKLTLEDLKNMKGGTLIDTSEWSGSENGDCESTTDKMDGGKTLGGKDPASSGTGTGTTTGSGNTNG